MARGVGRDPRYKTEEERMLDERGKNYGDFGTLADMEQELRLFFREQPGWDRLPSYMRSALDMIATKVSRILNGNPFHADSWHDIAGYARLVGDRAVPVIKPSRTEHGLTETPAIKVTKVNIESQE